jgi:hypothetical protein
MIDPRTALLSKILASVVERVSNDEEVDRAWAEAAEALRISAGEDEDLGIIVELRDVEALRGMVHEWASGERALPEQDRAVLKRAMKAFKKRVKLARLDDESTIGGGATSGGRESGIVGVPPPDQYPREVWNELVTRGRLIRGEGGLYELP